MTRQSTETRIIRQKAVRNAAMAQEARDARAAKQARAADAPVAAKPGDVIATYPYARVDAARRHALAIGGTVSDDVDDETGCWTVYGDVTAEAKHSLRETDDKTLLRKYRRLTYAVSNANGGDREAELRTMRTMIETEVLRRMGGA